MNSVGFIGFGLIGGSIAKALKLHDKNLDIIVYSRTRKNIENAVCDGVVNKICSSIKDIATADIIFICTPVNAMRNVFAELSGNVSDKTIITDVGSVKEYIHKFADEFGLSSVFVGGHPMSGSEKTSYSNASASLFKNKTYLITKSDGYAGNVDYEKKVSVITDIANLLGSHVLVMDCKKHDYAVAGISHIPHLASAALVENVISLDNENEDMKKCISSGFMDSTRIAASSPEMWSQICMTNRHAISDVLGNYINILNELKVAIEDGNEERISHLFTDAGDYRSKL